MQPRKRIKVLRVSKIDREKEFIGYLKVIFSIFVAVDLSLITWIYQKFDNITWISILLGFVLVCLISYLIVRLNAKILKKINDLEDI